MNMRSDVPPQVWIVDDSSSDAQRAHAALSSEFETTVFGDGSTVLERLSQGGCPDVLVLDWVMPAVSGLEVVRFIRESEGAGVQMQVLLLTVQTAPEQIVQGLNAGANDYLAKPYAPEELRARVRALMRSASLLARTQSAEATTRALVASSPDALLAVDGAGNITFANAEARRILDGAELTGRRLDEVMPELAERRHEAIPRDITLGARVYAPSVRATSGSAQSQAIITLRDVTDRRRDEQRRLDFYSIIAHDLRAPLQSMMLRTAMLREGGRGALADPVKAELGKLDLNIQSMIGLINDFLEMARTEAAAHTVRAEAVDMAALVAAVVESLEPLAISKSQRVRWPEVPTTAMMVHGDRRGLQQVVTNLLGNALKFSPPDAVIVVSVERVGDVVRTTVADPGPGIPARERASLFERYTRGEDQGSQGGSGLGLMIVRQLVEAHGGAVGVDSETGVGTRFWFDLPGA